LNEARITVLIADDHPGFRDGLREALTSCGFDVLGVAADGREALELATRLRPSVVLMDISMPVLNGLEATRLICASLAGVRVVGLSMHTEAGMGSRMAVAGAASFVEKSASIEAICDAIRAACRLE
jgi:DNA-binding NarL/FixJ family response regulator